MLSVALLHQINEMVPSSWKHSMMQRIPKSSQQQDSKTLPNICSSRVIYTIFLRCIIQRILPFIEPIRFSNDFRMKLQWYSMLCMIY